MTRGRLRVGAVPYLNARPLVAGLDAHPEVDYVEEVPARLAQRLAAGELDVALVSSIEAARDPAVRFVPGLGICSDGAVRSVKLVGRVDPRAARTVALDGASLTAATLTRVVYGTFLGRSVGFERVGPSPDPRTTGADATLVIGDAALRKAPEGFAEWDLGDAWTAATGLPFTWAVWLIAPGADAERIATVLSNARRTGAAALEASAQRAAPALGISRADAMTYLRDVIRYDLGPREREGLERFFALARPFLA